MKALDFLATLRERDIQVTADGDRLRCNAPAGALTPALQAELRQHKQELLQFLRTAAALAQQPRAIVPLQSNGARPPIFAVAGHNGDVFCFRALAQHLGEEQPFFGLQPPGLDGQSEPLDRVEKLAAYFAEQMRAFQVSGPLVIAGYCAGGGVAFELARQLARDGAQLELLALFGSPFPTWYRFGPQWRFRLRCQLERVARNLGALVRQPPRRWRPYLAQRWYQSRAARAAENPATTEPVLVYRDQVGRATLAALRRYVPGRFAGRVALFAPSHEWLRQTRVPLSHWQSVTPNSEFHFGPPGCHGDNMLRATYAPVFAALLQACREAPAGATTGSLAAAQARG